MKNFIKKVVRKKNSLFPKDYLATMANNLISDEIILTDHSKDVFFGYHDRTPFHKERKLVLSHRSNSDSLDVGFFDLNDSTNNFNYISSSRAFSKQQGTMLQWDYLNNKSTLNFNTYADGKYKNISININDGTTVSEIDIPIYCISNDYKLALSCNFFQLARNRPGYGINDPKISYESNGKKDGIWFIDRVTEKIELLLSYEELLKDLPFKYSNNTYINHLSFSPNNNHHCSKC